jgi:hypothetical protein
LSEIKFQRFSGEIAVDRGIGGISTAICLGTRFNVGSYDSADLFLRLSVKFSG